MTALIMTIVLLTLPGLVPPVQARETNQFSFWVGSWTADCRLRGKSGKDAWTKTTATSVVKKSLGGFVVEENFVMKDGRAKGLDFIGHSVSTFNTKRNIWEQTWVDNAGGYISLAGIYSDGKMILKTVPNPDAKNSFDRMVFRDIKKDSFAWDWEHSDDGGKTWLLTLEIIYKRAK